MLYCVLPWESVQRYTFPESVLMARTPGGSGALACTAAGFGAVALSEGKPAATAAGAAAAGAAAATSAGAWVVSGFGAGAEMVCCGCGVACKAGAGNRTGGGGGLVLLNTRMGIRMRAPRASAWGTISRPARMVVNIANRMGDMLISPLHRFRARVAKGCVWSACNRKVYAGATAVSSPAIAKTA